MCYTHAEMVVKSLLSLTEKRAALELVYLAGAVDGMQSSRRDAAKKISRKLGGALTSDFLLRTANKLPPGLKDSLQEFSLRRAVNAALGLDKHIVSEAGRKVAASQRSYSNQELMEAVLKHGALSSSPCPFCTGLTTSVLCLRRQR